MSTALIFVAAFCSVFLGCLQSINVVHGRRLWAAGTSLLQGFAMLTLYRLVPKVDALSGVLAFLSAGVIGGQLSMFVTRSLRVHKARLVPDVPTPTQKSPPVPGPDEPEACRHGYVGHCTACEWSFSL